jgi:hypothetical protein
VQYVTVHCCTDSLFYINFMIFVHSFTNFDYISSIFLSFLFYFILFYFILFYFILTDYLRKLYLNPGISDLFEVQILNKTNRLKRTISVFLCRITLWAIFRKRRKIFSHFFLMWKIYSNRTALKRTQFTEKISDVFRKKILSEKFQILFTHTVEEKNIFKIIQVRICLILFVFVLT